MKFLIDMPLSPELAVWLTQQKHDAVHAMNVGLAMASDTVILDRARIEQRIVITAEVRENARRKYPAKNTLATTVNNYSL